GERLLNRVLGEIDVAEDADQYRNRAAVLRPEDGGDLGRRGGAHEGQSSEGRSSDWNGRTSMGSVVISASRLPQASAASRSGASMMVKPPRCSLPSTYGPSVTRTSPVPPARSTVADDGGCNPPEKTHAPAARISSLSAFSSVTILSST